MNSKILTHCGTAVAALSMMLLFAVCSPEVKVIGDKEKPVTINAEIKIHIYQHAASVVDDLRGDAESEETNSTSMISRAFAALLQTFCVPAAYAAPSAHSKEWTAAFAQLKAADKKALPLLKNGMLGENKDGYIEVINKAPPRMRRPWRPRRAPQRS